MRRYCMQQPHGFRKAVKFSSYLTLFMSISLIPFMVSGPHMKVDPLSFQAPHSLSGLTTSHADVQMTAEILMVDPEARLIHMNWYPEFVALSCPESPPKSIDIYISNMLLDVSSPSWSDISEEDLSVFRLNSTRVCMGIPFGSFKTVTKLLVTNDDVYQTIRERSSLQSYPFDKYIAPFIFYSRILGSSDINGLDISGSFGVAVNFRVSLLDSFVDGSDIQETLYFNLLIERSQATKIFVIMVAVTNWLIAIAFLIICAAATIFTDSEIYDEMFVVPVGATFAFTSIRANLPGAPSGFGTTIDIFTTLPVLVIMSFCSFSLLLLTLYRRIIKTIDKAPKSSTVQDIHPETREDFSKAEIANLQFRFSHDFVCDGIERTTNECDVDSESGSVAT